VHGAGVIRDQVHRRLGDKKLATFAAFLPMVRSDSTTAAETASKELAASGIRCIWDEGRALGKSFAAAMGSPRGLKVAWDAYLLYGPDAGWADSPPKPLFYQHQLMALGGEGRLDGDAFRKRVSEELRKLR
jgi:hypothetical protein